MIHRIPLALLVSVLVVLLTGCPPKDSAGAKTPASHDIARR